MFRILRTIALFFAFFLSFDGALFAAGFTCDAAKMLVRGIMAPVV